MNVELTGDMNPHDENPIDLDLQPWSVVTPVTSRAGALTPHIVLWAVVAKY
jgi:hypothetical protein